MSALLLRLWCFFTGHRCRMYCDLVRINPERVECPCCKCGKVIVAPYGLALNATHDWSRHE